MDTHLFDIQYLFTPFKPVGLNASETVKLMNRRDRKFIFPFALLKYILEGLETYYDILSISGTCVFSYLTEYFDNQNNAMYLAHHNTKLNRYKIRRRTYIDTGIKYLEIKFKSNKGRTIKERIKLEDDSSKSFQLEEEFVLEYSPFNMKELKHVLNNLFKRITLVSKELNERVTIDIEPSFHKADCKITLTGLVIIEIKSNDTVYYSPIREALKELKIQPCGFSKYCIGRALTDTHLKQNNFKIKIRDVERITGLFLI